MELNNIEQHAIFSTNPELWSSMGSQDHTVAQEVCDPTSRSKQGQLQRQRRLPGAPSCQVLKISRDGDCTVSLGSLLHYLIPFRVKRLCSIWTLFQLMYVPFYPPTKHCSYTSNKYQKAVVRAKPSLLQAEQDQIPAVEICALPSWWPSTEFTPINHCLYCTSSPKVGHWVLGVI